MPRNRTSFSSTPASSSVASKVFFSLFLSLFAIMGLGSGIAASRVAWRSVRVYSWERADCRISTSTIDESGDESGDRHPDETYRFAVRYWYNFRGTNYQSETYTVDYRGSKVLAEPRRLVARFPEGSHATCWVNPREPSSAVLVQPPVKALLIVLLVPLVFISVGVGGIYLTWKSPGGLRPVGDRWLPTPQQTDFGPGLGWSGEALGPLDLAPTGTRLGRFLGAVLIAGIWNGVISVFVWHVIDSIRHGGQEWGLALFLSVFVLVGILLLLSVPYSFLALWNPRPHLRLSSSRLRLGEAVVLQWGFTGRPSRLQRLVLTFEGREEATVRRGKSTTTHTNVFHTVEVLDTRQPDSLLQGTAQLEVPANSMHSFVSGSCRVVWTLKVAGEIAFWPDLDESFEIAVLPRDPRSAGWR